MKTTFTTLLIILFTMAYGQAQFKRFNTAIGFGKFTSTGMSEKLDDRYNLFSGFTDDAHQRTSNVYTPLYAEAYYRMFSFLDIGILAVRQKSLTKYYDMHTDKLLGQTDKTFQSLMFGLRIYYTKPSYNGAVYSGLHIGNMWYSGKRYGTTFQDHDHTRTTFQIDVIGANIPVYKGLSACFTLGYGSRGIMSAGLNYTL